MVVKIINYLLLSLAIIGAVAIFAKNYDTPWQHFTQQAQSFLQGKTDIPRPDHDAILYNGKYYWPEGPFPSIVLLPFVFISPKLFHQGALQIVLIFTSVVLAYKLARQKKYNLEDTVFLITALFLGSTISGIAIDPKSWFFAQTVAITFLLGLIYEFENKRRWWLIGIYEGALIATRPTSGYVLFFLLFWILKEHSLIKRKAGRLIQLFTPIGISLLSLALLNFSRFGNIFNNGYGDNDIGGFLEPLRKMGVFSISHIPSNIYYYFLESVDPITNGGTNLVFPFIKYNVWGLSFFLVSPIFLHALKTIRRYPAIWVVIGITLINLLTYYAPGWYQFGPRYTADFVPLLFLLLLFSFEGKLSESYKFLISLSCIFNIYLLFTSAFLT